jgi:hypothetical protein
MYRRVRFHAGAACVLLLCSTPEMYGTAHLLLLYAQYVRKRRVRTTRLRGDPSLDPSGVDQDAVLVKRRPSTKEEELSE